MGFREMLKKRQKRVNSVLCAGLDPTLEHIPRKYQVFSGTREQGAYFWMKDVADAVAPFVSMFKPQSAHWEAIDGGDAMLVKLVRYLKETYPDIPIFLDCKRGDIGRTQGRYARAHLLRQHNDGMNFNAYMGADTLAALRMPETEGDAFVVLGYTSNKAAREIQNARMESGDYLWEFFVKSAYRWAKKFNVLADFGIVMAAAHDDYVNCTDNIISDHLLSARKIVGNDAWFLEPGFGTQGGYIEATVEAGFVNAGSMAASVSSGLSHLTRDDDVPVLAAGSAEKFRDQFRNAGAVCK